MTTSFEPHTIARQHHPRPWRSAGPQPRRRQPVIRAFCTPVVRELPPRRESAASLSTW
jgi:hypothetical protein